MADLHVPPGDAVFDPDPVCITCTPPSADPAVIVFSDHWKVVLHPYQPVLGACLIGARRHVAKLGEMSVDEATEFFVVYGLIEAALESVLGADLVNVSCLRNWAYREVDPDPPLLDGAPNPHVHWHVAPRYRNPVEFAGAWYSDEHFGEELVWDTRTLEPPIRAALVEAIREALPVVDDPHR